MDGAHYLCDTRKPACLTATTIIITPQHPYDELTLVKAPPEVEADEGGHLAGAHGVRWGRGGGAAGALIIWLIVVQPVHSAVTVTVLTITCLLPVIWTVTSGVAVITYFLA